MFTLAMMISSDALAIIIAPEDLTQNPLASITAGETEKEKSSRPNSLRTRFEHLHASLKRPHPPRSLDLYPFPRSNSHQPNVLPRRPAPVKPCTRLDERRAYLFGKHTGCDLQLPCGEKGGLDDHFDGVRMGSRYYGFDVVIDLRVGGRSG